MKKCRKFVCIALFFLAISSLAQASINKEESWVVREEFITPDITHFDCHSSSLVETIKGNLCAVWKGGPGTGKSNINIKENVGIWSSRFDGHQWSDPVEIVSAAQSVCWNPVLFKYPSGELVLFYHLAPKNTAL